MMINPRHPGHLQALGLELSCSLCPEELLRASLNVVLQAVEGATTAVWLNDGLGWELGAYWGVATDDLVMLEAIGPRLSTMTNTSAFVMSGDALNARCGTALPAGIYLGFTLWDGLDPMGMVLVHRPVGGRFSLDVMKLCCQVGFLLGRQLGKVTRIHNRLGPPENAGGVA